MLILQILGKINFNLLNTRIFIVLKKIYRKSDFI